MRLSSRRLAGDWKNFAYFGVARPSVAADSSVQNVPGAAARIKGRRSSRPHTRQLPPSCPDWGQCLRHKMEFITKLYQLRFLVYRSCILSWLASQVQPLESLFQESWDKRSIFHDFLKITAIVVLSPSSALKSLYQSRVQKNSLTIVAAGRPLCAYRSWAWLIDRCTVGSTLSSEVIFLAWWAGAADGFFNPWLRSFYFSYLLSSFDVALLFLPLPSFA